MEQFKTPILFLIFNRPDLTDIVFKRIREVKPKYLYIAADGPRLTHPDDFEKCKRAREIVLNLIDWQCELKILFRNENLGCGKAISEAITWFFNHVEEGIVLEDDTFPSLSFFTFTSWALNKYRNNKNVMLITGTNFQLGKKRGLGDYYFSYYPNSWGWASWKRAWSFYEYTVKNFSDYEKSLENIYFSKESPKLLEKYF